MGHESATPAAVTRGSLLRRVATGVAAVSAGGAAAAGFASASGRPRLTGRDRQVLEFALTLERLQTEFYAQALAAGKLTGETRQFAQIVGREERAHLSYVERALGTGPQKPATYDFARYLTGNDAFIGGAMTLEQIGLAAYNGQAGNVSPPILAGAARMISVEARHVAWARGLAGQEPAPDATDTPLSAEAATQAIQPFLA
ncbi:MAG: ferritin-like domain-containing protein [Solirubrobacterales bacterium]|nr:ferritin-like domain-containing protein [Solirubrobacterales bacterium]